MQGTATGTWVLDGVVPSDWFEATNNQPVLVTAVGPGDERGQWVLKPLERLGGTNSIKEMIGARFARWLGIPVPDHEVLEVTASVVDRLDSAIALRLRRSLGPNFGSRFVDGFMELERPNAVPQSARATAVDIFALDVITDHTDRNTGRSNVLIGNGALIAIDHEHTFSFLGLIGGPGPYWLADILHRLLVQHFFAERYPYWRTAALDHLRTRLDNLDAAEIDALTADMPPEWLVGAGAQCLGEIRAFLADVAAKRTEVVDRLEAVAIR
jgi:hypothetical protein